MRTIAMDYVVRGRWPLIAGSMWTGHGFVDGNGFPVGDLVALFDPAESRSPHPVWLRWSDCPFAILMPAGEMCDVLASPSWAVRAALDVTGAAIGSCPVLTDPGERMAWILLRPGHPFDPGIEGVAGVGLVSTGVAMPLPPTQIRDGEFRWWVYPQDCGYELGDPVRVQAELAVAIENGELR